MADVGLPAGRGAVGNGRGEGVVCVDDAGEGKKGGEDMHGGDEGSRSVPSV